MDEHEYLYLVTENVIGLNAVIAVMFTLVFGYLAALYLFLRHTGLIIRILSYIFVLSTLYFTWTGGIFIFSISQKALDARERLFEAGALPPSYTMQEQLRYEWMLTFNAWEFTILSAAIGLAFFYMTFFYKWKIQRP